MTNQTKTFDGSTITIQGEEVTVTEGPHSLTLIASPNLVADAAWNMEGAKVTAWEAERIVYCFSLAARTIAAL